jgi:hypothetical protein
VINYIKTADASYSKIITCVRNKYSRKISKGLVSYYRGERKGRIKSFHKENVSQAEWDWLVGLYYADGSRFMDRHEYMIAFALSTHEREILDKLLDILLRMKLKPRTWTNNNLALVRVSSKLFYSSLPNRRDLYQPRHPLAYLAGLMDGDGSIKRSRGGGERWKFTQAKYPHLVKQIIRICKKYGGITIGIRKPDSRRKLLCYDVYFLKDTRTSLITNDFAKYCIRCRTLDKYGPAGRI